MTILEDFTARFPEFDTAVSSKYIPILEDVYPCYWGGDYDTACGKEIALNLLAHLAIQESQASSSPLKEEQSQSVGNVSVSYNLAVAPKSERRAWFRSTSYGVRYLSLTMNKHGGCFV